MASALQELPDVHVTDDGVKAPFAGGTLLIESMSHRILNYCSLCNIHFDDLTEFDYHVAKEHKVAKSPKAPVEKIFLCSMCDLSFRRHDHLKRHIRSLHNAKKYSKCPVCSKEFQEKDVLSHHIKRTHAGKKEIYTCRECDYQCDSMKTLLLHELEHMDRHFCPHCTMSYKRRDHMTRHVKSEHMKLVVVCPVCEQIYKRKDHLSRHMREKHKDSANINSDYVCNS